MKKILIFRWNNLTFDIEKELEKRGHKVFATHRIERKDIKNFDVMVGWNESESSGGADYVRYAKLLGMKTVLLQHGRRGSSRIYPPFNEPYLSDKVCVWGQRDYDKFLEIGTPKEKLVITGTPIFQYLKRFPHKGINIVFSPEHWDIDVDENIIVAAQLRKLKGVNIISKLLKGEHNESYYDNPIVSSRLEEGHLQICAKVLSQADIIVGISESTFELMAEILDIPVVIMDTWIPKSCDKDERYKKYKREYSNACKRTGIEKLNETIYQQLKHPEELRNQRIKVAREEAGIEIENPTKNICDVIEQC
ncbi:MAG: hypothetical protein A2163_07160 [Actinobacteria bacterium RBG_13_35_12]|nr:MAG: hypothetical protein A2163_07160 [Actinobacteria bacterium RBG_13_35_12]